MKQSHVLVANKNPNRQFGVDFFASVFSGSYPTRKYFTSSIDIDPCYRDEIPDAKADVVDLFRQELSGKSRGMVIGFSQNPDPYDPHISTKSIMSDLLRNIYDQYMGLYIETTSDRIIEDIDVIKAIQSRQSVLISVPIGFNNDQVGRKIEIEEPSFNQKIRLVHRLTNEGINAGVVMKPIIPFVNDTEENILDILRRSEEAGSRFVYPTFGIVVYHYQIAHFHELIDNEYPGLKNIYMDTFGQKQSLTSINAAKLKKTFVFEAKRRHLVFGMKDIVKIVRPTILKQMKLF